MTKIKLCGLSRPCDIAAANALRPDYIGFVFAKKSRRYVSQEQAAGLKKMLDRKIPAVGVFVDEDPGTIAELLEKGIIDLAQLHGKENEKDIEQLRRLTKRPVIQAFRVETEAQIRIAEASPADYILLDSGAGTGKVFDWSLLEHIKRPYFLAGGLTPDNVETAVTQLKPYAVDVSSGIETDGWKDKRKMTAFTAAVRKDERQ